MPGFEPAPPLIESWRSTNELWMLYTISVLGSIWKYAHSHVLADFSFLYFISPKGGPTVFNIFERKKLYTKTTVASMIQWVWWLKISAYFRFYNTRYILLGENIQKQMIKMHNILLPILILVSKTSNESVRLQTFWRIFSKNYNQRKKQKNFLRFFLF